MQQFVRSSAQACVRLHASVESRSLRANTGRDVQRLADDARGARIEKPRWKLRQQFDDYDPRRGWNVRAYFSYTTVALSRLLALFHA